MTEAYPQNWKIGQDFDPNAHLMNLKGRDYLNVQNRLLWFIRDQRALIVAGLATMPYVVRSEIVEMDRQAGYAHFKTYVRDVLGNEATMYGSESKADFPDFAEKASTKSLGRALLALGYGTAFAPEMDEGERVVDTPMNRGQQTAAKNDLADKPSPADDQRDIFRRMKEADHNTPRLVREFTKQHIGREIDPFTLSNGKSDLTMAEASTLLLKLNERANLQGLKARGA